MKERFDEDTLYIYYYYNKNLNNYNLGFSSRDQYNEWVDSASVLVWVFGKYRTPKNILLVMEIILTG